MHRKICIIILLSGLSLSIYPQGMRDSVFRVPPVTITATGLFSKEEAGMKETRIDSVIILEKINMSLSGILSGNSTVFIKDHGRGALATASMRGTAPSHTQVNWNGMNINSPMAGMVDFSLIPVYIIDELNIRHGTASLASRSGGLGGSISINNSADWSNRFSGRYMQGAGSYSSFDEFLQFNAGNRHIQSKTRLYHNYSKNDYTFLNRAIGTPDPLTGKVTNPVDTNDNAAYKKYGLLQEIYLRPGSRDFLSVRYWVQQAHRTIPRATSYEGPDNSNLNSQSDTDHRLIAGWKHFGENSKLEVNTGYSSKQLDYILKNVVHGMGTIPVIYSESRQWSFMNKASYTRDTGRGFSLKASIDAGLYGVNTMDTVKKTGYDRQRFELSSFISLHKQVAGRLNIKLMLRQDIIDNKYITPIPYLGFDLRILEDEKLIVKGNIAANYHQPSLNDLYWQPGGNPDLSPEKGYSYELGLDFRKEYGNHGLQAGLTLYRSDINNWILWIPGYKGYWEPRNIKRVLTRGAEISVALNGSSGSWSYRLSGTYAYTSSVNYGDKRIWGDESWGKQLVYIPLHSGNMMFKLSYMGFSLSWHHNSYSERYTTSGNDSSRRDWLYPYFMNDLKLGKEITAGKSRLSASLKVYNLFNESYRSVLYRPMPGRNYMLLLMVKF